MAKIDTAWALEELDRFLHVTDQVHPNTGSGVVYFGTVMRGSQTEASERAHVVEQILDRVLPGWRTERPKSDADWQWLRDQASRAKAALRRQEEISTKLGDDSPEMNVGALHPWVWENGRSYWLTRHYHQAVMQAAIRVNAEMQAKLARMDVSETSLFNQAFSLDPPKSGASRLRLLADDGSQTYGNVHRGARALAEGLYAAIRNPGVHTMSGPDDEQLAMEQLAAFSLLPLGLMPQPWNQSEQ